MPIPLISHGITEGISAIPYASTVLKWAAALAMLAVLKHYFGGTRNTSERLMHSKVVMVTGGTSGIGAAVVHDLASRGAQIILLTQHAPSDIFLVDYIEDLRRSTNNELIYAEQVDLSSLHSVRKFATKWVDNAPPRRLDMIILCANTLKPTRYGSPRMTLDGLDEEWQVNYLANFHLLSILSPAIRAQPPDRDVRIIFASCSSYIGATIDLQRSEGITTTTTTTSTTKKTGVANKKSKIGGADSGGGDGDGSSKKKKTASRTTATSMYGTTKLSLMIFARAFQKHLSSYKRPDQQPMNAHVLIVDPGYTRTPGTRRWITGGSLWGLLLYLLTWPVWWLLLKAPEQGAQSFLYAAMEARFGLGGVGGGGGGWLIKECCEIEPLRKEVDDEEIAKQLWQFSEDQIQVKEKESAKRRALAKAKEEDARKKEEEMKKDGKEGGSSSTPAPKNKAGSKARTTAAKKSRQ